MTAATAAHKRRVPRSCPQCGSGRIYRSHRKGFLDRVLSRCGAEICRCHDCRTRRVWIASYPFRLASADASEDRWTAMAVLASGFLACLALVWWAITRFGELMG